MAYTHFKPTCTLSISPQSTSEAHMLNVAVQWYVGSWLAGWLVARQRGTVGIMWRTCTSIRATVCPPHSSDPRIMYTYTCQPTVSKIRYHSHLASISASRKKLSKVTKQDPPCLLPNHHPSTRPATYPTSAAKSFSSQEAMPESEPASSTLWRRTTRPVSISALALPVKQRR